jgi:hypothetical protein
MPMASCPLQAETTRYPLVASMNLSTESSCSLSSTQRMIFLGRMVGGQLLGAIFFVRMGTLRPRPLQQRAGECIFKPVTGSEPAQPGASCCRNCRVRHALCPDGHGEPAMRQPAFDAQAAVFVPVNDGMMPGK